MLDTIVNFTRDYLFDCGHRLPFDSMEGYFKAGALSPGLNIEFAS